MGWCIRRRPVRFVYRGKGWNVHRNCSRMAGPQITTPEELLTVPVFGAIGGISGGIVGCVGGFFFGATTAEKIYDWIFTPLEKEEWEVACEK